MDSHAADLAGLAPGNRMAELANAMVEALRDARLDEAERLLEELNALAPDTEDFLVFPVLIAIQRGFITEALQYLNGLDEDAAPELKALCLNILGDATWHYHAQRCLESDDPHVRKAMRELLQMPPEEEDLVLQQAAQERTAAWAAASAAGTATGPAPAALVDIA